jgi:glycosyltransferase involved in cell wall biosynthesis
MGISAIIITHNEEELLPGCLEYLNSLNNLSEICIVDDFSTDKTWDIILEFRTKKNYHIKQQKFQNFGKQKNNCIDLVTEDWILLIDADETYGYQLDRLLGDINSKKLEKYNAFRILTYITFPDKKHYINPNWLDPHVRIWRKNFCGYVGECHEMLFDKTGRNIHSARSNDIMNLYAENEYKQIVMLHHQRLKSMKSLIEKGTRWEELGMLSKSGERGLPVDKMTWARLKDEITGNWKRISIPIPKESWDVKE